MVKLPDYTALGTAPAEEPSSAVARDPNVGVVAQATQKLGETSEAAGSNLHDIVSNANVMNAMANQYQPAVRELATKFYGLSGKDALDAAPQFASDMAAAREQAVSNLSGDEQQKFQAMALPHESQELYRASTFAGEQGKVYAKDSNEAGLNNHLSDYSSKFIADPPGASDELTNALHQDELFQKSIGASPEVIRMRADNINANFYKAGQGAIQNQLLSMPGAQQKALLRTTFQGTPVTGAPPTAPTDQDGIINTVMTHLEGSKLVPDDNGHGPSKFGIVGANNGLTPQQTADLTPEQAKQIYKTNYWDAAGIDSLPDNMKMIGFDTAVQFGAETAKGMIAQADGDPQKLIQIRDEKYKGIIANNPSRYGGSAVGWQDRQATLSSMVGGSPQPGQPVENPTLFGQPVDKSTLPKLYEMAEATESRDNRLTQEKNTAAQDQAKRDFFSKVADGSATSQDAMNPLLPTDKIPEYLNMVGKGDKVDPNDPDVIKQRGVMENMKVDDPANFKTMDLSTLAGQLPAADISRLQSDQMKMKQNDSSIAVQNKQAKDITDSVTDMIPADWKSTKDSTNYAKGEAFKGNLIQAVNDAQAAGGKPLSRDDVRSMASDMLADVSVKGTLWDSTMKATEVPAGTPAQNVYRGSKDNMYIPTTFRAGFTRAWQSKFGAAPPESAVRSGYLKEAGK